METLLKPMFSVPLPMRAEPHVPERDARSGTASAEAGNGMSALGSRSDTPADDALHTTAPASALDFRLPPELEAAEPPEARGLARDAVRLMVSYHTDDRITHAQFHQLPEFLRAGDLLVINTSGTLNAALPVTRADGSVLELHFSTHLPADLWSVELRRFGENGTQPFFDVIPGETLSLPAGATATLHAPYHSTQQPASNAPARLWLATIRLGGMPKGVYISPGRGGETAPLQLTHVSANDLRLPVPMEEYLARYGYPIRYSYVKQPWSAAYYQTVYATEMGSAEMPSAGRAFTPELITRLVAQGVQLAPLVLHTGVASLEAHEPPYEEYYRVPADTARLVNAAHAAGRRVIAVGTTVVRALETVTDPEGTTHPGEGYTSLVVTPARGVRAVNGLLTGLHEPKASHLQMLAAIAGIEHLRLTYAEALRQRYLWHEFGDLHLILP